MPIKFDLAKLTSRKIRSDIGTREIRVIDPGAKGVTGIGAVDRIIAGNDFLGGIADGLGTFTGFLSNILKSVIKFTWSGFWSWVVSVKQFVWNFNWNATDEQLQASINSQWTALAGQIGGTLGNAFGYLACGILPGAVIFAFNEPLGAYVLEQVTEEALEEFLENLSALFNSALRLGTQIVLTETYKSVRKLIKSNSKLVGRLLGRKAEQAVKAWGSANSQPWSFAIATENFLDQTLGTDGWLREFAEEFLEEADEACVEAGYVVANSVDTFLSTQMLARRQVPTLGNTRYVEITPNRENPDEKIVLGGSEQLLKPLIISTLANYEQLADRDVGVVYGTPAADLPERSHRPEVVLKFYQKRNTNPAKGAITENVEMRISFRLMNKTTDDFTTDAYLKTLAEAIHREFATPPFKIHKGKQVWTYSDFTRGYQFVLNIDDQNEAKKVIKKVLDIQSHPFDDDGFRQGSKVVNSTSTRREKVTVRGKVETLPTSKKTGIVTFTTAYLNTGLRIPPIVLVDLTGKKKDVVYKPTT